MIPAQTNTSVTPTTTAIEKLQEYLSSIGHKNVNIYLKEDMIYCEFPKKVEFPQEQLEEIGNIFYWSKSLNVPYLSGLVHFYEYTDTLLVSVKFYDQIVNVYEYMISKGIKILEFDVCNFEFSFKYDCSMHEDFNEEALSEIKQLVDPNDERSRAAVLYKLKNTDYSYTLSVRG